MLRIDRLDMSDPGRLAWEEACGQYDAQLRRLTSFRRALEVRCMRKPVEDG